MSFLYPAIEAIKRGYAAWLRRRLPDFEREVRGLAPEDPFAELMQTETRFEPDDNSMMPEGAYDAVARQLATRPQLRAPRTGDLVVLPAPEHADEPGEPQYPAAVVLDELNGDQWSGWLVGSHVDYAGDRDLVLDAGLIEGGEDPAPIAGMVLCWDRVLLKLPAQVKVIHRLTEAALEVIRLLAQGASVDGQAPGPGRMIERELAGQWVVTGTPYGRDDARAEYLRLTRELARCLSEPEFSDSGRRARPDRQDPEK